MLLDLDNHSFELLHYIICLREDWTSWIDTSVWGLRYILSISRIV